MVALATKTGQHRSFGLSTGPASAIYVINTLSRGGAEHGLVTILENGFLRDTNLYVLVFGRGDGGLRQRLIDLIGEEKLVEVTPDARLSLIGMVRGVVALAKMIRRIRPQVVILSLKQANIVGRGVLVFHRNVRCVAFEHIARLERHPSVHFYRFLLRALSFRVDEVWADCPTTLARTRSHYPWPRQRREAVMPLFIASAEAVKGSYRIVEPIRLVMAGRLIRRKRFDVAIDALALLKARGIDARCTIFGTGPEGPAILARAVAAKVADRLCLAGFVDKWWREALHHDIFLQTSEEEGFCLVAAEAMMVGLPMITTVVGGLNDYSTDDVNAVHVPIGKAEALSDAIRGLASDEGRRRRLGSDAAAGMAEIYSAEAARRTYREVGTGLAAAAVSPR
ncbi:glycosyltransferase [Kaistia granuli]|uniref:glycosyltransferase n=1 Tax=Kaistia granuli TaxID=363259 RepID=UPI0003AA4A30|nr:glycosyltransferase [Kaistia granuli]